MIRRGMSLQMGGRKLSLIFFSFGKELRNKIFKI
jgi:hypothetical protein